MNSRIFKTSLFKFTLLYVVIFFISFSLLGVTLYLLLSESFEQEIKGRINNHTQQLLIDYRQDGIDELRHDIAERRDVGDEKRLYYFLKNASGEIEYDQMTNLPETEGWHTIYWDQNREIILYVVNLKDAYVLAIGSDIDSLRTLQGQLKKIFLFLFLFMLGLGFFGGYWLGQRFLFRFESLKKIARRIEAGYLDERMPVSKALDDFDQIALTMNSILDRIETLVHEVKQVSSNIAHDLRTPLGRIRLRLEQQLSVDELSPTSRLIFEKSLHDIDELLSVFQSLLRLSELNAEKKVVKTEVHLVSVINDLVETYHPLFEDQNSRILFFTDLNELIISGDKNLLIQMFVNLLENSIGHNGQVEVNIKLAVDGQKIFITVDDDGIGISETEIETIFKPFYRCDKSRNTPGHGLGLSLVKAIVQVHGGRITSCPRKPRGVVFSIELPLNSH